MPRYVTDHDETFVLDFERVAYIKKTDSAVWVAIAGVTEPIKFTGEMSLLLWDAYIGWMRSQLPPNGDPKLYRTPNFQ